MRSGESSEGQTDASNAECARRWEEALKKCKVALKPVDFDIVSRIDSPEKLLAGIEDLRRQTSSSTTGIPAFLAQNALTKSFSELSLVFIASMSPYPVTTGVIWGLLYLAVKVCLKSRKQVQSPVQITRVISAVFGSCSGIKETCRYGLQDPAPATSSEPILEKNIGSRGDASRLCGRF